MSQIILLTVNCGQRPVPQAEIERVLAPGDWMRFNINTYFFVSYIPLADWERLIKPILHPEDTFLLIEVNIQNRHGWVPGIVRSWLMQKQINPTLPSP